MNSFTEENYLKALYKLSCGGAENVSTNAIAAQMGTKAASVTDMMKRLAAKKLVSYKPYQGVKLSETGKKLAIEVIRKHRLWEVFLVNKLNFKWDEVHDIAEQLEHINSPELINRLDLYLEKPAFDPHGDPIPDASGRFQQLKFNKLSETKPGALVSVVGVLNHSASFLQHLEKCGLQLGTLVQIKELNAFDRSLEIKAGRKGKLFISHEVANQLLVSQHE